MILQLFLAGQPYRKIAKAANISLGMVSKIVQAQMKLAAKRRDFLQENAYDVYMERLEDQYARAYARSTDTKLKPAECRRLLDSMIRLSGAGDAAEGLTPPGTTPAGDDDDDDEDDDELGAYRKRARG